MLIQAATQLGCLTAVMERDANAPAMPVATQRVIGDWTDSRQLRAFARQIGVVTVENEFIDATLLAEVEADGVTVRPGSGTLRIVQDKLTQRDAFARAGLPVPTFQGVSSLEELVARGAERGWPLVLKTRRNGYDGKGTAVVRAKDEARAAWERLRARETPVYAEDYCGFERELAIVVCRSAKGEFAVYPVVETVQQNHVCHVVRAPAAVPAETARQAQAVACAAVEAVQGIGCFGVELFLMPDGRIVINEVAPRVHNSGHYTIEACACSQFENHVRAVMGWPLGATAMRSPAAAMVNILAATRASGYPDRVSSALQVPGAHLHLYGKAEATPGRKMGHVTVLGSDVNQAVAAAESAAAALQFSSYS